MANEHLGLSAGALSDMVEEKIGGASVDAGDALVYVEAGYRRFLQGVDPLTDVQHVWSFLRPRAELDLAATTAGTATGVYSAGDDETTITSTASDFVPGMVGESIVVTDVGTLTLASYTSPTIMVASEGEAFTAKAFTIATHKGIYTLPDTFGGLADEIVYIYDSNNRIPITQVSPDTVYAHRRATNSTGTPQLFAIEIGTFAAATGANWQFIVAPRTDAARTVFYRFKLIAPVLTDSASVYLMGGAAHSWTLRAAAIADWENVAKSAPGPFEQKYQTAMHASIEEDKAILDIQGPVQVRSTLSWPW